MNNQNSFDVIDRKILSILQQDGRITNVKLASEVGLSPPTVLERVRKLEERGVIQKYVALVDPEKVNRGMTAFVMVSLAYHRQKDINQFHREIMNEPEVLECYHVGGEEDFLIKVVERDIAGYRNFLVKKLTQIEGLQRVRTLIVFNTIKRETCIAIDDAVESDKS